MSKFSDLDWIDARIKQKDEERRDKDRALRNPAFPNIDAGLFADQLSSLAYTLINKLEREGGRVTGASPISIDVAVTLRYLRETYNLLRFLNSDRLRADTSYYRTAYSFVCLPLVRTMIDGLFNCSVLFNDPSLAPKFRISGYYRIRENLIAEEKQYGTLASWQEYLKEKRQMFEHGHRVEGISDADMNNRANKWQLLGEYLDKAQDSDLKRMLKNFTLGIWKEYSSLSHASYDGLIELFPIIGNDRIRKEKRVVGTETVERLRSLHFGRAAGLLLCLLTEIQNFYRFDGARVNERLRQLWDAMQPIPEIRELHNARYDAIVKALPQ